MALSKEQLLLLNNLMYTNEEMFPGDVYDFEGRTVKEFIDSIDREALAKRQDCGCYMTGEDYVNIFNAIEKDSTLMNMEIVATHIDDGPNSGKGFSAVFVDKSSNEAVVTFKGTGNGEWPDNFSGAANTNMPDRVSTQHQVNALDWYKEVCDEHNLNQYDITVTGHSKGGNKAKYITVLDDSVNRCVSFDGQGFSDEFFAEYENEIAENQGKIENHSAEYDPINLLINDIGESHYYTGYNTDNGNGGFMENHCPNTPMKIDANGNVIMTETTQPAVMQALDTYLNGLIRNIDDPEKKQELAKMVGDIVVGAMEKKGMDFYIETLLAPENSDNVAYILAYTLEYAEALPETLVREFTDIPVLPELLHIANKVSNLDNDIINTIRALVAKGMDYTYDKICEIAQKLFGLDIKIESLDSILAVMSNLQLERNKIKIGDYKDKVVRSGKNSSAGSGQADFTVAVSAIEKGVEDMRNISNLLNRIANEVENCKMNHTMGFLFNKRIAQHTSQIQNRKTLFEKNVDVLDNIAELYRKTENSLCSSLNR